MGPKPTLSQFFLDEKTYELIKFRKTNQGSCINLKPIVAVGDRVEKGHEELIAGEGKGDKLNFLNNPFNYALDKTSDLLTTF